jgi:RND family efflux transporter MFP subunit
LNETRIRAERERKLVSSGVVASAAAEDLESRVASLQQNVKAAQAQAAAAAAEAGALNAQVEALKTGLKNLILTAPINGTVINKPPQIGEFVGPQPAGVSVDMGGIRIADFSTLVVETDIPEGRLALVKVGAPTEIVLDAYPSQRFRGRVKEITPQVDRAKATVVIKVEFVDRTEGVLPDMSARVSFLSKELDEAALKAAPKIVIPGSAVTERGGSKVAFVFDDGQARLVPIQVGARFGNGFELVSGPRPGTQVIADPPATLADGQKVKQADAD